VLISGIVALTLSPMISARVLRSSKQQGRFEHAVEASSVAGAGLRSRAAWLARLPERHGAGGLAIIGSIYIMYT
jgi:multidrug efflux pump